MKNSSRQKSPERSLIMPMICCVACGLTLLCVPTVLYLKGHESLKVSPLLSSVPIATYDSVADLAHWFMFDLFPIIGFCFLCIGYLVLKAYRKVKIAKEKDNADA
jgi:hypothetical protein